MAISQRPLVRTSSSATRSLANEAKVATHLKSHLCLELYLCCAKGSSVAMKQPKYPLPDFLKDKCDQKKYSTWLHRKAQAHATRDRKRNRKRDCTVSRYKADIHNAVLSGGDRDFYTNELLDWSLISTFENDAARMGRSLYKKKFWLLPTVDHTFDERGEQKFVICSWKINDAKSDLTLEEFHALCETVLRNRDRKRDK
jgi:hypothetical protein